MKRHSTATWHGSGKEGKGSLTSQSNALHNTAYTWGSRFSDAQGTNPEELIAAAHAGCFTMKLSFLLSDAGYTPDEIITTSTVEIEGSNIIESHLEVSAKIQNISHELFMEYVEKSKDECPVSKALNMKITVEAKVESIAEVD